MNPPTEPGLYAGTLEGGDLVHLVLRDDGTWLVGGRPWEVGAVATLAPFYRIEVLSPPLPSQILDLEHELKVYAKNKPIDPRDFRSLAVYLLQRGVHR